MLSTNETWALDHQSARNKNSSLNSGEFLAIVVEHRREIVAKKWIKSNQREKIVERQLKAKTVISKREEKLCQLPNNQLSMIQKKTRSPPWIPSGKLYFQVLYLIVFQFQLNSDVFHRYDGEFFVRNLESSVDNSVKWGKPPRRIHYLHYCTWAHALMVHVRNYAFLNQG